ncbi:YfhO family protein [Liquorilactobacillus satsumensis]|uniref:YfhO family protein n=1 Tax=Liquorilactobacillus satsumensis TaxID=259059 RepID=UPI0021C3F3F7|nr:YfhO family protein [Liquorilactobacillus satsumensis]MCP9358346.1 YfhO family protein [Liquorilactobacillus satsumensis]MCP9372233.1 YfhO family protein [Liquorilactobacillus satsumensis]
MKFFKNKTFFPLVAFCVPMLLLLLLYSNGQIFPFGSRSVANEDLINQYAATLTYFRNNIFHPENLLYSFQLSLGGNFFAVFTYYLSSPLNLISLLFPQKDILAFFTLNMIFNIGMMGLTMYLFLTKSIWLNRQSADSFKNNGTQQFITIALSTSFALTNFFLTYANCVMWFNAISLFPLVLLGLDRLLNCNRPHLYWPFLVLLLLTNYYMGIITVLFLILVTLLWIAQAFLLEKKALKSVFLTSVRVFGYTLLSLLSSLVVFIPSWLAQQHVSQAPVKYDYTPIYKSLDVLAALFPGTSVGSAPLIYSSLLVPLLVIAFFFTKKIGSIEKNITGIFLLFIFISTWLSTFYMFWHGFTMPNGYFQRESFVVVFVLVCIAYRALKLQKFEGNSHPLRKSFWVLTGILFFSSYFTGYFNGNIILLTLIFLLLDVFLLELFFKRRKLSRLVPLLLLLLVSYDIYAANTKLSLSLAKKAANYPAFSRVVAQSTPVFNKLNSLDHGFFRVATTYQLNPNDPLEFNYRGMQNYLSQQPTRLTNFLSAAGYFQKHSWLRWSSYNNGSTLAMDSFLGIKYVVANNNQNFQTDIKASKSLTATNPLRPLFLNDVLFKQNAFTVYQNKLAFPLAFKTTAAAFAFDFHYSTMNNPFVFQNQVFKALGSSKDLYQTQQITRATTPNQLDLQLNTNSAGNLYLYVPSAQEMNPPTQVKIYCNGKFITTAFGGSLFGENGVISLGRFSQNTPVKISLTGGNIAAQFTQTPFVAVENQTAFTALRKKVVANSGLKAIQQQGTTISFKTTKSFNGGPVMLSLPYDQGWSATVDGHPVGTKKALKTLTGLEVPQGNHHIVLHYRVPGLRGSLLISLLSLLLLCLLLTSTFWHNWKKKLIN